MIVYKWVHKRNGKYYSLLNFGYFRLNKSILINQEPYELDKTYINNEKQTENIEQQFLKLQRFIPKCVKTGFYFWIKNYQPSKLQKERMIECGAPINAILKCEIKKDDILSFENNRSIRVKKFKVLEELLNEIK